LKARLISLGFGLNEAEIDQLFERFKSLADKKKTITDADIEALVSDELYQPRELFTLDGLQVACGTMGMPTATVRLRDPQGSLHIQACVGTGPVDAAYKAIDAIIQAPNMLEEFVVHAVTEGIDALGEVTVRSRVRTRCDPGCAERNRPAEDLWRLRRRYGHRCRQRQGIPGGD